MRESRALVTRSFLCLLLAGTALAQNGELSAPVHAQIDDAVSHFMAKESAPGVAVAVVRDGEYVWAGGYGLADLENFVPVTPETLFRLASVSKPISAVAAMQLWEQGKLDLDAPILKYCPAFPEKGSPITTRELLGHLGGIRHYREGPAGLSEVNNTTHFADPIAGGLSFFKDDALVAQPGTHYHYSTQGYTLVGCAIAAASGESYVDYVRENVFARAGMTVTQADDRFALIQHRTRFYSKDPTGKVMNSEFLDSSYKIPGGGWLSSASDIARFEVALLGGKLVRPETFGLMSTPQTASDGSEDTYGLGLGVIKLDGAEAVGHSGGQQGTSTMMLLVPSQKLGVVVLANMDQVDVRKLARDIATLLLATK